MVQRFVFRVAIVVFLLSCSMNKVAKAHASPGIDPSEAASMDDSRADWEIVRPQIGVFRGDVFGDYDDDGDVDYRDYVAFQLCLSFSGTESAAPPACDVFDSEPDGDVDLGDLGDFLDAYTDSVGQIYVEAGNPFPSPAPANEAFFSHLVADVLSTGGGLLRFQWVVRMTPEGAGDVILRQPTQPFTEFLLLPPVVRGAYEFEFTVTNLQTGLAVTDVAVQRMVECLGASHCTDGQFCTGEEECGPDLSCRPGDPPCEGGCDEDRRLCAPPECNENDDCDDGRFCNGEESCRYRLCVRGEPPCFFDEICVEAKRECQLGRCFSDSDCDDGLFCNGTEQCVNGTCVDDEDPCRCSPGCNEANDTCEGCQFASDCDDGLFCNGLEVCVDGSCVGGAPPCAKIEICHEDKDSCGDTPCTADVDCDDDFLCTIDHCTGGLCHNEAVECVKGMTCNPKTGDCEQPG